MSGFIQDLQYGVRSFAKHPGFTAVAVLTLALGVGANAAIFSVLRAVVLRDLPYHEADRIAVLWTKNLRQNLPDGSSFLNFRDWKEQSQTFEDMAAYIRPEFTRDTMGAGADAMRVQLGDVGPGFFRLLGTAPVLGRTFEDADFGATTRTIVISHSLWQQRFGGSRGVIGTVVPLGDRSVEIVGVMPPDFQLPTADVQLWRPLWFGPQWQQPQSRGVDALIVLGRLRGTATFASARTDMDALAARLAQEYPATNTGLGVSTDPLVDKVVGRTTERSLWLLFGSVGFVLLIACANVTNLVLARAATRRTELSVRTAIGAGRSHLVRQALTENLLLAIVAAVVGLLFAWLGTMALRSLSPGALPRAETITLDAGVLLFLLIVSLASGLIAGVIPAWQSSSQNPSDVLREGGPRASVSRGGRRLQQGLVVAEIALAVVLLAGAGLLIRSFLRVRGTDRGFDTTNVLLMQIDLPRATYNTQPKTAAFFSDLSSRIRALPGVLAVGAVGDFFIHRQPDYRIALEGQPPQRPEDPAPPLTEDVVFPGYFEAMRVPLLRGRLLRESDLAQGAPLVVVINEEMGRRFWPGQDPIGKRFKYGLDPGRNAPWKTVVGVVSDMRRQRLDEPAIPYMFQPGASGDMDIAVRTQGDPETFRQAIRAEMGRLDPNVPPYGITTIEGRLARTVALRRLQTLLLAALAGIALVLSVIGAYGVIHQSVTARTQEIGIRMALGADRTAVLRMVLAGGLTPAICGLGIGLVGSVLLSRTISSFLYETNPLDPLIYLAVTVLLLIVTTVACFTPARRATRFDPVAALRNE